MKMILIGAGGIARELLPRLSEMWEVTVVDSSPDRLERLSPLVRFRPVSGDGSSRLVLSRAGLETADAVVAATDDDDVNLEACRLAHDVGIRRMAAVLRDSARQDDYRDLGIPTISAAQLAARRVESHLERRRISSTAFADGKAEAIEFRVAPDSPGCGRSLRELHARSFIVGAILREGQLVVPHGDTVLREDDLVTVVGAGSEFAEIVRTFNSGEQRFPLEYGKRVAVVLENEASLNGTFSEAIEVARNSQATSILQLHSDPEAVADESRSEQIRALLRRAEQLGDGVHVRPRPVRTKMSKALEAIPADESVGVIVVRAPNNGRLSARSAARRALTLTSRTGRPVLLSRSTHPYRRILVPGRGTAAGRAAIRAGIDLARGTKGTLHSIAVLDPLFFADLEHENDGQDTLSWVEEEAAARGVEVEGRIVRGNPVRLLLRHGADADLIVLGTRARRRRLSLQLSVAELVATRSSKSVLLVPVRDPT